MIAHIQPQDELQLVLNLTINFDTVTKTSQTQRPSGLPEPKFTEVANRLKTCQVLVPVTLGGDFRL